MSRPPREIVGVHRGVPIYKEQMDRAGQFQSSYRPEGMGSFPIGNIERARSWIDKEHEEQGSH